jgi:hypothetical protein
MKPELILMHSPLTTKKYRIIFPKRGNPSSTPTSSGIERGNPSSTPTSSTPAYIDFGDINYNDYLIYNLNYGKRVADIRRDSYLARHAAREDWTDPYSAGFWSRFLLWEKRSLKSAIRNIERMLGVNIVMG